MISIRASSWLIAALIVVGGAIWLVAACGLRSGQIPPISVRNSADAGATILTVSDPAELRVDAYWEPIKDSQYDLHHKWEELGKLRPAFQSRVYSGSDFRAFLPGKPVSVGEIWALEGDGLLTFLRQFHSGATLRLHINNGDSLGAYACLRGVSDQYAQVVFRIHAEFVLRDGFFTPGQFTGSLVLDRASNRPVFFRMYLPPAPVNFDVGWRIAIDGHGKMTVGGTEVEVEARHITDAGCVPRMELIGGNPEVIDGAKWLAVKSLDEVKRALALRSYRFKNIEWVEFEDALRLARKADKPLHVVAVDGTLDDESC